MQIQQTGKKLLFAICKNISSGGFRNFKSSNLHNKKKIVEVIEFLNTTCTHTDSTVRQEKD